MSGGLSHRDAAELEARLGYEFLNRGLLIEARTHKSYYHEQKAAGTGHNERLEFLGDAILGLIIVEYLFREREDFTEAVLAKLKSYLVSEPVLSHVARSLEIGEYILLGKGEESTGGRTKKSILADALEAVIGAVYLDSGYEKAREIVLAFFKDKIDGVIEAGEFFDFKTELQEKTQMLHGALPEYRVVKQEGEDHERIFTVSVFLGEKKLGTASGRKKKEAETLAAKKALESISGELSGS